MSQAPFHFTCATLILCAVFSSACKKEAKGTDTTAPVIQDVKVRLEAPTPPNPRGEFDITAQDVTKSSIPSNQVLRLIATVGDPESGIRDITVTNELRFRCAFGSGSETIGVLETVPLTFTPAVTPPSGLASPAQINVVADPMGQIGCATGPGGRGPIDIEGLVRVVVTNGDGMTTTGKTFIFDYVNVGAR